MRLQIFTMALALCLCLVACSNTTGDNPQQKTVPFTVSCKPASEDMYGNVIIDYESMDSISIVWTPPKGYCEIENENSTDTSFGGIKDSFGMVVIDYAYVVQTDGINLIDNMVTNYKGPEVFYKELHSTYYRGFVSALPYDGDWLDKNSTATTSELLGYYGYLFDCTTQLGNNSFLVFHYHAKLESKCKHYDDLPEEIKAEILSLMDSFSLKLDKSIK